MRLSAKERTGLHAMVEFARHHGEGPLSLSRVADAQSLPLPYLERVAAALRRAGLLESVRGAQGGYLLARRPQAISVGDVFRAVEGSLMSLDCMRDDACCDREATCAARSVWEGVSARLRETLDGITLADVLSSTALTVAEPQGDA
jgi:Rrf2 family cysteine metabolism transcriptional repressor